MKDETEIFSNAKKIDSDSEKCQNCGGRMIFNPKLQKLQCEYCLSTFDVSENAKIIENPIEELLLNAKVWSGTDVVRCSSCGAKEIVKKGQISKNCVFCGSANVVKTQEIVGIKPHGICPFEKTNQDAEIFAKKWASKKWFAPKSFKKTLKAQNICGIYCPVFTFDCKTDSVYRGMLFRTDTETYFRDGKMHTRTRTTRFRISGKYSKFFDDLIVQASENIPDNMMKKLEPFPTNAATKYNQSFLYGYSANTYSKEGIQAWKDCKNVMSVRIKNEILSRYIYTGVESFSCDTNYSQTKFKYILLPIYVGHFDYKQKLYNFYINGTNGKVAGDTPTSFWKVLLVVLLVVGIAAFFAFLFFVLPQISQMSFFE